MSLSNYTAGKLLDHLLGTATYTAPSIYVALSTTTPTETGGVTEPSGGSYARVLHGAWNAATSADPSVASNTGTITFPTASGSWGTVTHVALYDAAASGNLLGSGALGSSAAVGSGDVLSFADSQLSISMD